MLLKRTVSKINKIFYRTNFVLQECQGHYEKHSVFKYHAESSYTYMKHIYNHSCFFTKNASRLTKACIPNAFKFLVSKEQSKKNIST